MTLQEKIALIDVDKTKNPTQTQEVLNKIEKLGATQSVKAMEVIDQLIAKITLENPNALKKTVLSKEQAKRKTAKLSTLRAIVPKKADLGTIEAQIKKQYPNWDDDKIKALAQLRIDAQISRAENFNKMLDTLSKSQFYGGKELSTASIDKGRGRSLEKDSKQGSITEADELRMTKKKFKRISKAGRKNQYGTTKGGKVYYEYRMNRRDVDNKIRLKEGGSVGQYQSQVVDIKGTKYLVHEPKQDANGNYSGWVCYKAVFDTIDGEKHLNYQKTKKLINKKWFSNDTISKSKIVKDYFKNGGYLDAESPKHVLHIDGQNWYLVKIDSTHFYMSNSPDFKGMAHHIGQHKGEPYYDEVSEWLKTTKMAKGGGVEGRFQKHFKKGGKLKATYIPNRDIKNLKTVWGNNIKGKDLIDGAYTTRKNIKQAPKVARTQFEEETFEFGKGGVVFTDTPKKQGKLTGTAYTVSGRKYTVGKVIGRVKGGQYGRGSDVYELLHLETWSTDRMSEKVFNEFVSDGRFKLVSDVHYAKGGSVKKKSKPQVVRYYFEDEAYEYADGGRIHTVNGRRVWRWYPEWTTAIIEVGDVFYYGNNSNDFMGFEVVDFTEQDVTFKVVEGSWGSKKIGDIFKESAGSVARDLRKGYYVDSIDDLDEDDDDDTEYGLGGGVESEYPFDKEGEPLWNAWSYGQRLHFLNDHFDTKISKYDFTTKYLSYLKSDWDELSYEIKYAVIEHQRDFRYADGGKTKIAKYGRGTKLSSDDTPKIWVGEWSLYNEGKLIGEWVDLSDFDNGAEVMDKIQALLDKWTKETGELREEYAIFDYENFSSSLYSEGMGEDAFDKIIASYKISQEKDIPADVIGEIMSDYGLDPSELEDFFEERYIGYFENDEDLGYYLVDEMNGGIENMSKNTLEMYFNYESYGRDSAYDFTDIDGYYFYNH